MDTEFVGGVFINARDHDGRTLIADGDKQGTCAALV